MTKQHATRKKLRLIASDIYIAGDLYPLWDHRYDARFYNSGYYGWNWDATHVGAGIFVLCGYRNFVGKHLPERAEKILRNAQKWKKDDFKRTDKQNRRYINAARKKFFAALWDDARSK